jgi:HAD superfamily hydrolase (TIGR01549 family)
MATRAYSGEGLLRNGAVHCVLFDLDGTLYDSREYNEYFDSQMTSIVSEVIGVERDEASRILQLRRKEKGTLTGAMESLGINRQEFHRLVAERVEPNRYLSSDKATRKMISRLKGSGLKIGLVSNSGRNLVKKILEALELEPQLFDAIITGTDVEPKPSQKPFLMTLERIGCDKASTVYVGDREEVEIRPAHEMGIRTVLISRDTEQKHPKWADVVITNLGELEKIIIEK